MLLLTARWNVEQVYIQWAHVSLLLVSLSAQELVVGVFFARHKYCLLQFPL